MLHVLLLSGFKPPERKEVERLFFRWKKEAQSKSHAGLSINIVMGDFVTEAFTLLAVAVVVIGLRTTARWIMVGPRNFQADDYLMPLACVSILH